MSWSPLSRRLALLLGLWSTAFAWQADRMPKLFGGWTDLWVITCKDGSIHAAHYGPAGPSFAEGDKVCKAHGGLVRQPTSAEPISYQIVTGPPERLSIALGELVNGGVVDPSAASRLTNSRDPAVWATTKAGLLPFSSDGSPDAVTVKTTRFDLPEPATVAWWWIVAAGAALLALVLALRRGARARV